MARNSCILARSTPSVNSFTVTSANPGNVTGDIVAGDFLHICIASLGHITGVSDSVNGAWTQFVQSAPGGAARELSVYGFINSAAIPLSSLTITVTLSANAASAVTFCCWTGLRGMAFDTSVVGTGSNIPGDSIQQSLTLNSPNEFLIWAMSQNGASTFNFLQGEFTSVAVTSVSSACEITVGLTAGHLSADSFDTFATTTGSDTFRMIVNGSSLTWVWAVLAFTGGQPAINAAAVQPRPLLTTRRSRAKMQPPSVVGATMKGMLKVSDAPVTTLTLADRLCTK